jgi:recA bacterial DNA recombination protein
MSSFPLFSSVCEDRPFFAPQSVVSPRKFSVEMLLTTSLHKIVPASRLEVRPSPEMVSSGVRELDALTGGLPRGCLTEVCGHASSGRTSLLLATLASATQRQEACALVDVSDAFDPSSAASAGVNFERLLWVRCGLRQKSFSPQKQRATEKNNQRMETPVEQALRVTDLLLQSGGFGLVAIDLGDVPSKIARRIPLTSWFRFQRAVEHTPTVLFVITQAPCAQTCASLLLRMQSESLMKKPSVFSSQLSASCAENPSHAEFLDGFDIHAEVLRSRMPRKPSRSVTAFATKATRFA